MEFFGRRAAWLMALLVVVLALPAFGVTAYLEYDISTRIHGVQNERAGLVQIMTLANFQQAASEYSLQLQCGNTFDGSLRSRADAALPDSSDPDVRSAWKHVRAGTRSGEESDSLLDALDDSFMAIGDAAGITYDAEFAGVSLADSVSYRLPEALAQLRSARGLLCNYGAVPSLEQRLALKRRQVLFDKLVADAMVDTRDAIRLLGPRMDVTDMKSAFPAAKFAAARASAELDTYMLTAGAPERAAAQRSLTAANLAIATLLHAEFPMLDKIFEQRLSDYGRQQLIGWIPGLIGLLAAIFVVMLGTRLLSQHAALELERQRATEQEAIAMHDGLTGIKNRRAFFTVLDLAVQGGKNHGLICIFDIDHFKEINDTYGHLTGDELLVRLARTIEETVRPTDAVARLGGDEFALFLHPPVEHRECERILERITAAMKEPVAIDQRIVECSVSAGASWITGSTMREVREALGRADTALYVAKTTARGGYRFSEDGVATT
ncbi:MAG TPA: GGDEF domain-containing protein [Candidatus Baltobacteraceae bacterium]|nr:GGDEF domain-containing protein [Candidatus Baltobacteraceae bacterium]